MPLVIYDTAITGSWVCPAFITRATIRCWGGGAAGRGQHRLSGGTTTSSSGGGGGCYVESTINVTPGYSYDYVISAGAIGVDGSPLAPIDTSFSYNGTDLVVATGGSNSTVNCIGDIKYAGGKGSAGNPPSNSGGGGGGAGTTGAGGNAGTGGGGGTGTSLSGGNGGSGGGMGGNASSGHAAGGGGGGTICNGVCDVIGGNGAIGRMEIEYYFSGPLPLFFVP